MTQNQKMFAKWIAIILTALFFFGFVLPEANKQQSTAAFFAWLVSVFGIAFGIAFTAYNDIKTIIKRK
jgi:hypothetical protein